MKQKLNLESIINFLLETELFCGLTAVELSEIASIMDIQKFKKGEVVFSEGDIGDGWYVLYEGEVLVSKHIPFQKDKSVASLHASSCFGEMAILDSTARSATIFAKEDSVVFRFPRRKFEKLLEEGTPMTMANLTIHVLSNSDNYNIKNRTVSVLPIEAPFI